MPYNKYTPVFTSITRFAKSGYRITKEELVFDFTNGRTKSLRALDDDELKALILKLSVLTGDPKNDAIRKAIISQFKSIGRTVEHAISWAEKYGVNGAKKRFNAYDTNELMLLLQNAKKVKGDFTKAVLKVI
jgi:hypothetical protein